MSLVLFQFSLPMPNKNKNGGIALNFCENYEVKFIKNQTLHYFHLPVTSQGLNSKKVDRRQ